MAAGDNFKRNLEDEAKYLQIQQDIKETFKDQVTGFKGYVEYQNRINKNWGDIKIIQKQINDLEHDTTVEGKKKLADLKKQQLLLVETNKQLAKQGGLLKSAGNILEKNFLGVLGNILTKWFDFDEAVRKTGNSMGLSATRMRLLETTISGSGVKLSEWGDSMEVFAQTQGAFSEAMGNTAQLSADVLYNMSMIGKKTGLGAEGVATMAGEMGAFGFGATTAVKLITAVASEAEAIGVNSGKVLKSFQSNLGLMNKLSFKNGVAGMMKMAAYSEKYKIDMNDVASVADKVFRPEGAIEAAAQLQVLGGSLAALGDPMQLMYKARNAPEELAKSLTKAASASATWDESTKEWKVNAMELDRLKEAASALGMDYTKLAETAKQTAKVDALSKMLDVKNLPKETVDMLTGLADAEGSVMTFGSDGKAVAKQLSDLSAADIKALTEKKDLLDKTEKSALSMREEWNIVLNQLQAALMPMLQGIQNWMKEGGIDNLSSMITEWLDTASKWVTAIKVIAEIITGIFIAQKAYQAYEFIANKIRGVTLATSITSAGSIVAAEIGAAITSAGSVVAGEMAAAQSGGSASGVVGNATKVASQSAATGAAGAGSGGALGGLAAGLSAMGTLPNVAKGALILIPASVGLAAMVVAIPALLFLGKVNLTSLVGNMDSMALGLSAMGTLPGVALGSVLLIAASVGFAAMTLGAIGLGAVALLGAPAGLGLEALGIGLAAFGATAGTVGWLGVAVILALSAAFIGFSYGVTLIAEGIATVVNSFTSMFAVIGENGAGLLSAGLGFMALAAGVGILTISLIGLGMASLFALPGLLILGSVTSMLTETASALASSGGSEGISKAVDAINKVDQTKLDALKELSMFMALAGASPTIKFDEDLKVSGQIDIKGESGGKTSTDWVNNPQFVATLRDAIAKSSAQNKKGGTA